MGMFDSLYEGTGTEYEHEWQTKAYYCNLDTYHVGDRMPEVLGVYQGPSLPAPTSYQVEVLGGRAADPTRWYRDSFATIRDGILAAVPAERDHTLPLVNYSGHVTDGGCYICAEDGA